MSVEASERAETCADPPLTARSSAALGLSLCALSALFYTAANICMRQLSALGTDPTWAACNKETVTVLLLGPWLLYEALRGRKVVPPRRELVIIVLVGLTLQIVGNQSVYWALGVVGLSVTIPVIFAAVLTAGSLLGWVVLGERVPRRSWLAIGVVMVAIVTLSLGAEQVGGKSQPAEQSVKGSGPSFRPALEPERGDSWPKNGPDPDVWLIALAVLGAAAGGTTYAMLTVTIRTVVTGTTRCTSLMFLITLMGTLSLGPLSLYRLGWNGLLATTTEEIVLMLAAGLMNFAGFIAITRGLQLTSVLNAAVLNASQIAMAAVAGLFLFHEPFTTLLVLGVALTIGGILLVDHSPSATAEPL